MGRTFYSPGFNTFYIEGIHDRIPEDRIEVTPEEHELLMDGPAHGMHIEVIDGRPVLVENGDAPDEVLAVAARRSRNVALVNSDRFMLVDAPVTPNQQQKWIAYRKALRDLPAQAGFPREIQWPVEPT